MADISKISPDDGSTILNIKDSNAVHYGDQSKGYVGKNLFDYINGLNSNYNATHKIITNGVNVKTSLSTSWGNLYYAIPNIYPNAAHKFLCDIDYVSGISKVIIRTNDTLSSTGEIVAQTNNITSDQTDVTLSFTTDAKKYIIVQLFVTLSDAGTGEANYTKLLIQLASISDTSYEPYLVPNTDLMSYADNTILGAKNLINCIPHIKSVNGGTITINSDGTVIINGTFTAQSSARYDTEEGTTGSATAVNKNVVPGNYIVTFGGNNKIGLAVGYFKSDDTMVDSPFGYTRSDPKNITLPSEAKTLRCYILVEAGTYNNYICYPMIRLATDTDSTFAPYAMTNRELTNIAGIITRETSDLDSNSDMNDAKTMGIYGLKGVTSNIPAGESALWGFLLVLVRGDGAIFQFVIASQKIFVRYFTGSWQSWYKYQGILAT